MKPSKYFLLKEIEKFIEMNPNLKILDLGAGQSLNFKKILEKYPSVSYTALEPNKSEHEKAKNNFAFLKNVKFINALAYEDNQYLDDSYDVVVSLSVLEHIKYLEKFLLFSAKKTAIGGHCIHLYDLGHALYPTSIKEKIHVFLCTNRLTKKVIPEIKFVSYVDSNHVIEVLKKGGLKHNNSTYHNMPNHVKMLKSIENINDSLISQISENEIEWSKKIKDKKILEKLFPSVCIWCQK